MFELLSTIVLTVWISAVLIMSYALAAACAITLWGAFIIFSLVGIWDWWHGK